MTRSSRRYARFPTIEIALIAAGALLIASPVAAQEGGPECPPGFVWQRMSGVGCVQEDCFDVANAKLSYTSSCICLDGYKACYEPVDISGIACDPFCPTSRLVACVDPDALCPGEEPAQPPPPTSAASDTDTIAQPDQSPQGETTTISVDDLVRDLENFLAGASGGTAGEAPTAGEAAAGGAALASLIGAWVLINALSGVDIADLLRAVQSRQRGSKPGPSSGPPQTGRAPSAAPGSPAATSGTGPAPGASQKASSPVVHLSTSGTVPAQPASTGLTTGDQPSTPPGQPQTATKDAAGPRTDADPALVAALERRFRQVVAEKIREGYYVRNTSVMRKAWNQTLGRASDLISGHKGGQCGDFADWGKTWTEPIVRDLFGPGAIVDTVYIGERSTRLPDGFLNAADALYEANHAATRVTLPTGESYILDYWAAVGDQQLRMGTDAVHDAIFGGAFPRNQVQLIPEKEWIQTWKPRIGDSDAEVHNMSYAQQELRACLRIYDTEEEAIQAWRDMKLRGVQDHQMQTVINSWHKNGVWWER